MTWAWSIPMLLQTGVILADEFRFHRARGLPLWERIGHPIDTLSLLACFGFVLFVQRTPSSFPFYVLTGCLSLVLITKDEWVHARECDPAEHWLHAWLFILHPLVLVALALVWPKLHPPYLLTPVRNLVALQAGMMALFLLYQVTYWNLRAEKGKAHR